MPQQASTKFEERAARILREYGLVSAERLTVKHPDRGDIGHVPGWTTEVKSIAPGNGHRCPACHQPEGRFDMAAALDQAERARLRNGHRHAMVFRQRRNAPDGRQIVLMEAAQLLPLIVQLQKLAEGESHAAGS